MKKIKVIEGYKLVTYYVGQPKWGGIITEIIGIDDDYAIFIDGIYYATLNGKFVVEKIDD